MYVHVYTTLHPHVHALYSTMHACINQTPFKTPSSHTPQSQNCVIHTYVAILTPTHTYTVYTYIHPHIHPHATHKPDAPVWIPSNQIQRSLCQCCRLCVICASNMGFDLSEGRVQWPCHIDPTLRQTYSMNKHNNMWTVRAVHAD